MNLAAFLPHAIFLPMDDPVPTPTPDEDVLTDLTETAAGRPLKQPPADALAMAQRLKQRAEQDLTQMLDDPRLVGSRLIEQLRADIRDLNLRIAEYQHQLGNQN